MIMEFGPSRQQVTVRQEYYVFSSRSVNGAVVKFLDSSARPVVP